MACWAAARVTLPEHSARCRMSSTLSFGLGRDPTSGQRFSMSFEPPSSRLTRWSSSLVVCAGIAYALYIWALALSVWLVEGRTLAVYPLRHMVVAMFCWDTAGSIAPGVHAGSGVGPGPAWQEAGTVPVTFPGSCTAASAPTRAWCVVEDDCVAVLPAVIDEHPEARTATNVSMVICSLRTSVPPAN